MRFWWFSEDFGPFPEDFRRFSKIVPQARLTFPNIFREFPKMSEYFLRLPKIFEGDPKMFRWYTNEFKYNLGDKLDIGEITDIFTCEDIVSFFYQFVTTRYTSEFYIINNSSPQPYGQPFWVQFLQAFAFADQNPPGSGTFKFVRWPFLELKITLHVLCWLKTSVSKKCN